jgi:ElaB/YqjD/DUF883 family membrane-anchored ribosome-binding protein
MNETLVTIFIIVAAIAIVVQMGVLIAMYFSMKKTSNRVEMLANEVQNRALPTLESAHALIVQSRPKVDLILDNLAETSTRLRGQVERVDDTLTDIVDRTRLQVIRADELVTRTMDRVEETTEFVQHSVISPIRRASGVLQGIGAGLGFLLGRRRGGNGVGLPQDEMFI